MNRTLIGAAAFAVAGWMARGNAEYRRELASLEKAQQQLAEAESELAAARNLAVQAFLAHGADRSAIAAQLRASAGFDRRRAGELVLSRNHHLVLAEGFAAIAGEEGTLLPVASKFADAIKDIEADIAAQKAKQTAESAAAEADDARANAELADAERLEKEAASLESPVEAGP